ncbi:S1 family peptidase [Luteibacter sp.]|uniref:S1 family peptidase n=1 Tax=Luteibacter sp. TaxID=1886636 RepID=UPI003F822ABA
MTPLQLTAVERLDRCTVRITTDAGKSGTGFFFFEPTDAAGQSEGGGYILIITCRHVLANAQCVQLIFTLFDAAGNADVVEIDEPLTSFQLVGHIDPDVDLVCLNISGFMNGVTLDGYTFDFTALGRDWIPGPDVLNEVGVAANVLMVGYPDGQWDHVNNKPVFRRGITATNPKISWQGRREFLIDMAVYQGSSGSPIVAYDHGAIGTTGGQIGFGTRSWLIGINQGVYEVDVEGQISINGVAEDSVIRARLPMNLGECISADRINELVDHFRDHMIRLVSDNYSFPSSPTRRSGPLSLLGEPSVLVPSSPVSLCSPGSS